MNTYYIAGYPVTDELYHHGIKGQRWGIRRFQNPDGTLTAEGRKRYLEIEDSHTETNKRGQKRFSAEKYDQEYQKLVDKLGTSFGKVNEQWVNTLDEVYSDNYNSFVNSKKKQIEDGLNKYRELSRERQSIYSSIRAEEAAKRTPSKIREIFESDKSKLNRNIEINTAATERARKNDEYKKIAGEMEKVSKQIDKLQGEYKTTSMEKILNKLPAKDRQAAYDLMRYYWWHVD